MHREVTRLRLWRTAQLGQQHGGAAGKALAVRTGRALSLAGLLAALVGGLVLVGLLYGAAWLAACCGPYLVLRWLAQRSPGLAMALFGAAYAVGLAIQVWQALRSAYPSLARLARKVRR